jgi:hypothetical protein
MHSPIYARGGVRVRLPPLSHTADRRFQCLCGTMRFRTTYMGIEDLNSSESRVSDFDACSCLAYKPVSAKNVKGRPIQGIWVYGGSNNWKP